MSGSDRRRQVLEEVAGCVCRDRQDAKALTQARLRELLSYDLETGEFRWIKSTSPRALIGAKAGTPNRYGYLVIRIDGVLYRAHRLAWLYMTGEMVPEIDHENRDKSDNKWKNLRQATRSQNNINKGKQSNNTSGFVGVSRDKVTGKWKAYGWRGRKKVHLGSFATPEAAAATRNAWVSATYGQFAESSP